jgi:hypothetical protein
MTRVELEEYIGYVVGLPDALWFGYHLGVLGSDFPHTVECSTCFAQTLRDILDDEDPDHVGDIEPEWLTSICDSEEFLAQFSDDTREALEPNFKCQNYRCEKVGVVLSLSDAADRLKAIYEPGLKEVR